MDCISDIAIKIKIAPNLIHDLISKNTQANIFFNTPVLKISLIIVSLVRTYIFYSKYDCSE